MGAQRWRQGLITLSIAFIIHTTYGSHDFSDIYGPYCSKVGCCNDRVDECAAPILGTLCYCDQFCDMTSDDCCPDYETFCLNRTIPTTTTTTSAPGFARSCTDRYGNTIRLRRSIKDNCRLCTCEPVSRQNAELMCETDTCLIEPDLVSTVNQESFSLGWTASNYSKFWGHKLKEGIDLRLGTKRPHKYVMSMNPVRMMYDPNSLPRQFDAEAEWPGKLSKIRDQGWCASSWAISTADVASDRYAIISNGIEQVTLSPQHLLSCDIRGQQSCAGGYLDRAWLFIRKYGLVDEQCFPYQAKKESCKVPIGGSLREAGCIPIRPQRVSKYRVSPAHRLGNESDIMFEILNSGPVQATMRVYHDFFSYQSGIYRRSDLSGVFRNQMQPLQQDSGYHSVRIVGWGEEYTRHGVEKYWKVANSWGRDWGEEGYFRIRRGYDECEIESFVLGTWPEIEKNHQLLETHRRRLSLTP